MLKIDLHIHTQKCKSGDGTKRNITPENFIKKMYGNDVCICAITNHNKFDLEEFKKIKSLDDELTIFPGIELDVVNDKYQSHIVLVCDPEKAKNSTQFLIMTLPETMTNLRFLVQNLFPKSKNLKLTK